MSTTPATAFVPDLDRWLAQPTVRTYYHREAASDRATLWRAAGSVRIGESGLLGRLVRWRVPGTEAQQTYREMFTSPPFLVIEQGDEHLLAGLCGKIWAARPVLAELRSPAEFAEWRVPGTVRVLFAQWVAPAGDTAALVSEVRVAPVDPGAARRLRTLWPLIGRFESLISSGPLSLAVRRAENDHARRH